MIDTFNQYLGVVDSFRSRGYSRDLAHWMALSALWPEGARKMANTDRDPRGMSHRNIDSWLGWLVVEWNRNVIHRSGL